VLKLLKSLFEKPKPAALEPDPLLSAIALAFPSGPVRRGSLRGGKASVIDEVLVFDGGEHWFFVFVGCGALGVPFELSFRTAKLASDEGPPQWPIEPVTRVANAIGDGAKCALGVIWRLGSTAIPNFAAFVTLRDLQFGAAEPKALYQLVPITAKELQLEGDEQRALFERLYGDPSRMIGVAEEA
jgi:hypothetical protein